MKIRQDATGQEIDIPDDAVGEFAAKGGYSFPEGAAVPVRHDDGSVSTVPIQQFWAQRTLYAPASQSDVQAHIAKQEKLALDQEEAHKDELYGEGIGNILQTGAEATARGLTLGASDWVAKQMGADMTAMREREKRNPVSAFVGEAIGFVAPAILTGGASILEEGGIKAAVAAGARATPAHIVSAIGEAVGQKVAAQYGEGFMARVAAGTARGAAEGAIMGLGGEVSAKSLDNQDLLHDGELSEYLQAAGYGALGGAAFGAGTVVAGAGLSALTQAGSKAWEGAKGMLGKASDAIQAPVQEAEADLLAAKAADYDGEVRAIQQKYDTLKTEDLSKLEGERTAAKAKLEAAAPTTEILPGAAGMSAHTPIDAVTKMVAEDAERLGVPRQDVKSAMDRVKGGHEAFTTLDAEHDAATRRIATHLDTYNEHVAKADEIVDFGERMAAVGKEMATDRTAPPAEMIVNAMREQHAKMADLVQQFVKNPDGQVASAAQMLTKILRENDAQLAGITKREFLSKRDAIEAFRLVDHSQRVMGRIRERIGERSSLGSTGLSEALEQSYEDTRQFLKNPNVVGERAAKLIDKTKADWSEKFTVGRGASILSSADSGGNRVAHGFDTYRRGDPAKIASFLKNSNSAEGSLQLELVGRNFDADIRRLKTYATELSPSPEARAAIKKAVESYKAIADEIVAYRSRDQLAREFAAMTQPALREFENLDKKVLTAQEKAQERLAAEQVRLQDKIDAAKVKAGEARDKSVQKAEARLQKAQDDLHGGIAGGLLEAGSIAAGAVMGGMGGAFIGYHTVHAVSRLAGPVLKVVAKGALQAAIRTGEAMSKYRAALKVGKQVEAAIGTLGDSLHAVNPGRTAGKMFAFKAGRDVHAEFEQARQKTIAAANKDARAAYLMSLLPQEPERLMLRSDLDRVPKIDVASKRSFLRSYRGAMDPVGTIHRAGAGAASREEIAALQGVYPQIHARAVQGALTHAAKLDRKPSMQAQIALGRLTGQPVHFSQQPQFISFTQLVYGGAAAQGQSNTDMSSEPRARQVNAKGASAMATPSQRLEGGVGTK